MNTFRALFAIAAQECVHVVAHNHFQYLPQNITGKTRLEMKFALEPCCQVLAFANLDRVMLRFLPSSGSKYLFTRPGFSVNCHRAILPMTTGLLDTLCASKFSNRTWLHPSIEVLA